MTNEERAARIVQAYDSFWESAHKQLKVAPPGYFFARNDDFPGGMYLYGLKLLRETILFELEQVQETVTVLPGVEEGKEISASSRRPVLKRPSAEDFKRLTDKNLSDYAIAKHYKVTQPTAKRWREYFAAQAQKAEVESVSVS